MRTTRKTKKTVRWTLDGGDAFQVVELVKFMEDALKKPKQRYQIKIAIEKWVLVGVLRKKYWESRTGMN